MSRVKLVVLLVVAVALAVPAQAAAGGKHDRDRPTRVLMLVLDQARPDTIKRYDMDNVKRLQRDGKNFPNALLGHMAAETVISHNVLTSGLFPKNMGWTNEVYRDTVGALAPVPPTGPVYHVTSSMTCAQYRALLEAQDYWKLQDFLDAKFGESSVFASISQKRSSACTAGHTTAAADGTGTDAEDVIFQIRGSSGPNCGTPGNWRVPEDANNGSAAPYFPELTTPCNRWSTWQEAGAYGTKSLPPASIYPLDGNRFVPGFDPAHLGGDVWDADAAIRIIESPAPWRGMMVSLGGIDKLGHMWGPEDNVRGAPGSEEQMRHLPFIAKTADRQVGRIVGALKAKGLLDETLIVITSDHAAQTGRPLHGDLDGPDLGSGPRCNPPSTGIRSDCNWYYGQDPDETYLDPSDDFAPLVARLGPNLRFSYQDGHIGLWLNGDSDAEKREAAEAVLDLPDTIAAFRINAAHDDYRLHDTNRMSRSERSWFERHGGRLVDTMAHPSGPEVVALVEDNVTWGVKGDHGGHNKLIQSIPMVFYGPGVSSKDSSRTLRHVDVLPTILSAMDIDYDDDAFDGEAVRLSQSRR